MLCSKSRRTIERDIKSGKLSCASLPDGKRAIDATEILRVYGAFKGYVADVATINDASCRTASRHEAVDLSHDDAVKMARLEAENAALKMRIEDKEKNLDDLRRSILLLENKQSHQPKKKRFWLF